MGVPDNTNTVSLPEAPCESPPVPTVIVYFQFLSKFFNLIIPQITPPPPPPPPGISVSNSQQLLFQFSLLVPPQAPPPPTRAIPRRLGVLPSAVVIFFSILVSSLSSVVVL